MRIAFRCSVLLLVLTAPLAAQSVALEPAFTGAGLSFPIDLQHDGDNPNLVYVVGVAGVITVLDKTTGTASPFLDISNRVVVGGELGLLGLAFHPDYATNGYFYVNYTAPDPLRTVIARFSRSSADPLKADSLSQTVVLQFAQPFPNHNGGQIAFSPDDGFLYIATGDGGSAGDPLEAGQDRHTLLGKLLRIDVDQTSLDPATGQTRNYAIPPDNPLVGALCGALGCRDEIYAYGLRNPWRFSFDPPSGRLWLADVGQGRWEEVNVVEKGGNYGWDVVEGPACYEPLTGCDQSGLLPPVWSYAHGTAGISITGGYVYRGPSAPSLVGRYIYGDYGSGRIWALSIDNGPPAVNQEIARAAAITSFGVDAADELYVLVNDPNQPVYRLVQRGTGIENPAPQRPASLTAPFPNPARDRVTFGFTVAASGPARLVLVDVLGREVAEIFAGMVLGGVAQEVQATGLALAPGLYIARLDAAGQQATRTVVVR